MQTPQSDITQALSQLSPSSVWQHFYALSQIPRGSLKEQQVSAFVNDFGKRLGLSVFTDDIGNVIIKKPATKGMQDRKTVALQSHLDMVQQKMGGLKFNFDEQPIDLILEGDWLRANDTTLGADNGIGVAMSMAVLSAKDIAHPAIEAVFTVDEERGMTGAEALKPEYLQAEIMLNLDMESDHELTIGCAGGVDVLLDGSYTTVKLGIEQQLIELKIDGGLGGHSGLDIHLNRMNGIKVLASVIDQLGHCLPFELVAFNGQGVANVIPAKARATIAISAQHQAKLEHALTQLNDELVGQYRALEPRAKLTYKALADKADEALNEQFAAALIGAIKAVPHGVSTMSPDVVGLVETSNNVACVVAKDGQFNAVCFTRTCVPSDEPKMVERIGNSFAPTHATLETANGYPGWEPNADNQITQLMRETYADIFAVEPGIVAIHAGLECGILSNTYPDMQIISYGPNIENAHSPKERVQISSVQKVWQVLVNVLSNIPHTGAHS